MADHDPAYGPSGLRVTHVTSQSGLRVASGWNANRKEPCSIGRIARNDGPRAIDIPRDTCIVTATVRNCRETPFQWRQKMADHDPPYDGADLSGLRVTDLIRVRVTAQSELRVTDHPNYAFASFRCILDRTS